MHRRLSPHARLAISLILASLVAVAGCRGLQGPESSGSESENPPAVAGGEVEAVGQALAGVWTGVDIGASAAGSSSVTGTTGTVTGAGPDIWGTADGFRFHYMTVTGNVTITAQVTGITAASGALDSFAKAGIMMRAREGMNLAPGDRNVMALVTPTAANGYRFQNRSAPGGTTARTFTGSAAGAGWLQLIRTGNVFSARFSTDGVDFSQRIGPDVTITGMPSALEVGLAVSSRSATAPTAQARGAYANITFNPPQNPPSPPPAPASLNATPGNNQVDLLWPPSSGATSYTVQRSTTPGSGHTNLQTGITATSFTDTTAANGTRYYYVVRAVNASGTGAASPEAGATPALPPPGNLTATPGNNQVALSWNASGGATSYTVKRSTTQGSGYTNLQTGITATNFTDATAANGTPYYYIATASNGSVESIPSNEATATPQPPAPPGAPTSLTATPGNAQVMLSWSAVSGATSYTVKRSPNTMPRSFANVQTGISGTSYTNNTGLTNGTTYVFVVTASGPGGESPNSPERTATPVAAPVWQTKDIGTVGLTGTYSESAGTHTVRGAGADMYNAADAFRFVYQTITGDVTITARVTGLALHSGGGTINQWAKAALMIREDNDTPGARNVAVLISPTATNQVRRQLRATAGQSTSSIKSPTLSTSIPEWLRLERVGNTFRSYHAESSTGPWTEVVPEVSLTLTGPVRVGMAVTSHSVTQLVNGTFTNVSVVTPAPPAVPTGVTAQGQNNQVFLRWDATPGATTYTVKRATASAGPYTVIATNRADPFVAALGLTNGNTYWFTVSAQNSAGTSNDSAPLSAIPVALRPSVRSVSPADGATGVDPVGYISCELISPNYGGGVDRATLISPNVILQRVSDGVVIASTADTSGGGDVINLQPMAQLEEGTEYRFTITDGVRDTTGAAFMPFTSSFTTGLASPPPPTDVEFDQVDATGTRQTWTSIAIGPDNRVYAGTITGQIYRYSINADGTLANQTIINTVRAGNGNTDRAVIGMTFDPTSPGSAPVLWVTNGGRQLTEAPNWTGKLAKLSGLNLVTYEDYVVNFPRSYKDHMTNSIAFKSGEPGVIYITQGSMNAMGAPDNNWGQRKEHLLAAAILRVDTNAITTLPLNVQTNDNDETSAPGANGRYNPFSPTGATCPGAADCPPVTIYATGVRNAYDILWHSNGSLYSATNGSAGGGNTPATPNPLPAACTRRIDKPTNGNYTGPSVPALTPNPIEEDDYLYRVVQGGYYGHPNPSRCEWVLNGGNPTSGTDNTQVANYPTGVQPDRNWRGNTFNFGAHHSPNGMIEWKATSVPSLMGKLLIIRYANGNDILVLTIDPMSKDIIANSDTTMPGMGGFTDPLDITHNVNNGDIYVTEHAGQRIVRLRPRPAD